MRIIIPKTITPEMLTACNVPETDYTEWSTATAYTAGNLCMSNHKNYECLVGNTNFLPENNISGTTPKWLDLGYNNRWKMFDQMTGSKTSQATSITFSIAPGIVDSIAFLDVYTSTISIVMTDPSAVTGGNPTGQVYPATIGVPAVFDMVLQSAVVDAYTYFFTPIITEDTLILLGLPPYAKATITVTISMPGDTPSVGTIVFGAQKNIGRTQYNPTIGIQDYSIKQLDSFGNYVVLQRAFSKRLGVELEVLNTDIDDLQRTLALYRATPVVWVGSDDGYSSMIIYGFYKSFGITIPYPSESTCSIEIEGLS